MYETLAVIQGILGAGIVAFASVLLLWLGGFVWRRVRDRDRPSSRERVARSLLGVVSLLWLAVLVIFLLAWINFNAEAASPSLALQTGEVLRYVALGGTIGAVVAAGFAWRDGYWNRWVRLHYSVVTALALLFAWQLSLVGILPL